MPLATDTSSSTRACMGVSVMPGDSAFTRMGVVAYAIAKERVIWEIAALLRAIHRRLRGGHELGGRRGEVDDRAAVHHPAPIAWHRKNADSALVAKHTPEVVHRDVRDGSHDHPARRLDQALDGRSGVHRGQQRGPTLRVRQVAGHDAGTRPPGPCPATAPRYRWPAPVATLQQQQRGRLTDAAAGTGHDHLGRRRIASSSPVRSGRCVPRSRRTGPPAPAARGPR